MRTFHVVIVFIAPYICTVQYLVKQTLCSSFILIYFVVNSYIVNKALKSMGAQPPEIEHHRKEAVGLRNWRPWVSERGDQGSLSQTHAGGLYARRTSGFSWARGGSGSFATSSSHSAENPPACS